MFTSGAILQRKTSVNVTTSTRYLFLESSSPDGAIVWNMTTSSYETISMQDHIIVDYPSLNHVNLATALRKNIPLYVLRLPRFY